jgi:hypothetical protein
MIRVEVALEQDEEISDAEAEDELQVGEALPVLDDIPLELTHLRRLHHE